jgi:GNAT superfamily N-acetyltransferase
VSPYIPSSLPVQPFLSCASQPFPFLPSQPKMAPVSSQIVLRTLEDLDYSNTRSLMAERFSRGDLQNFIDMWYYRNIYASLCVEFSGAILGFALVVDNKLEYLVVSEHCEGMRFGSLLVRYMLKELEEQGYRSAVLMTANDPTLRSWYGRQGFELSSTSCDSAGISGDTMVYRYRTKRTAAKKHPHASSA